MLKGFDEDHFQIKLQSCFTPAQPISKPEHLYGREQKLRLIDRAFHSPGKHIFIYGDRGVGKTSLARTAAAIQSGNTDRFVFVACDQGSEFFLIVENIYRQLRSLYAASKFSASSVDLNLGVVKLKGTEALGLPALRTINDAIEILKSVAPTEGPSPIVILDEFDQLSDDKEKKYFADLIKQISDQDINLRLIICGIGSSLEELIGVHLSTDRYLATVPLDPLPHDARWKILESGADVFGVGLDKDSKIRIGQLSDGFPYYVHLIGEKIFWEAFDDEQVVSEIGGDHYMRGIRAAVEEAQTSLKQAYDLATQKHKNSEDYEEVLWAVADGNLLTRQVTEIYEKSYLSIMKQRPDRDALVKEIFYQRLNRLKKDNHGSIVIGSRQGWYGFRENVVRGYVRMRAEKAGVHIGLDHIQARKLTPSAK